MPSDQSFADLMARLQSGDSQAETAIFERFAARLIALARTRLGRQLQPKVDPEDVLQSVYKSFFLRQAQGQFHLRNWDSLWALLTVLTIRKCGRWIDRFHADCRDVRAEEPGFGSNGSGSFQALASEPTPSEVAVLTETLERLLADLSQHHRRIVALHLQGYAIPQISAQVHRSERTVARVLRDVSKALQRACTTEGR